MAEPYPYEKGEVLYDKKIIENIHILRIRNVHLVNKGSLCLKATYKKFYIQSNFFQTILNMESKAPMQMCIKYESLKISPI